MIFNKVNTSKNKFFVKKKIQKMECIIHILIFISFSLTYLKLYELMQSVMLVLLKLKYYSYVGYILNVILIIS
jgi:hypothetical protein